MTIMYIFYFVVQQRLQVIHPTLYEFGDPTWRLGRLTDSERQQCTNIVGLIFYKCIQRWYSASGQKRYGELRHLDLITVCLQRVEAHPSVFMLDLRN